MDNLFESLGEILKPEKLNTMQTQHTDKTLNTILAFHIGRGGRYHNAGHLSFIGEKRIGEFTFDLFNDYENRHKIYKLVKDKENLCELYDLAIDGNEEAKAKFEKRTNLKFGEEAWFDSNGNPVGLTIAEELTGIGRINQDEEYDTTYTCYLKDCNEKEMTAILANEHLTTNDVIDYCNESLKN